jgi:hypothetical protein
MRRSLTAVSLLAIVAAACSSGTTGPPSSAPATDASGSASSAASTSGSSRQPIRAESVGCEPGRFHWEQPGCEPAASIPLEDILPGGPPPDGIPPIDDPVYETLEDAAGWLTETSPVMVVDVDGDVRVYPLAILTWHEIVNDIVGGRPLVITYCPLCNSALAFERTVESPGGPEVLDFGTSGRLYRSNLVMYDRQHRNLWTQFEGEAVVGEPLLGTQLERVPAWLLGFGEIADLHPDARVLSRDTGFTRDYGRNPYTGYDAEDREPFLFRGELDETLPPMTRLVGLATADDAVAITLEHLADERTVTVEFGEREVAVLWAPGQSSALDAASIDAGRDVGQTAAFDTDLDGTVVELRPADGPAGDVAAFVDINTGSTFDLLGRGVDGPLRGERLQPIPHDDTFWFVWVVFRPDTRLMS